MFFELKCLAHRFAFLEAERVMEKHLSKNGALEGKATLYFPAQTPRIETPFKSLLRYLRFNLESCEDVLS